jgi:hypothetical protein
LFEKEYYILVSKTKKRRRKKKIQVALKDKKEIGNG